MINGRDLVGAGQDRLCFCACLLLSTHKLLVSCFYVIHILSQTGGSCCLMYNGLKFPSIEYVTLHFDDAVDGSWLAHKLLTNCS